MGFRESRWGTEQEALRNDQTLSSGGWGSWQWGQGSGSSRSWDPGSSPSSAPSWLCGCGPVASRLCASVFPSGQWVQQFFPFCRVESSVNVQPCSPSLSLTPEPSGSASTQDPRAQRVKSEDSGLRLTGHFARFSTPWTWFTQSLPGRSSKALPDLPIPSLPALFSSPSHSLCSSLTVLPACSLQT